MPPKEASPIDWSWPSASIIDAPLDCADALRLDGFVATPGLAVRAPTASSCFTCQISETSARPSGSLTLRRFDLRVVVTTVEVVT